jgi:uncharacterized XkdX family phage protein
MIFDIIKRYYDKGYYTNQHIADFVKSGVLTPDQYKSITGDDYV